MIPTSVPRSSRRADPPPPPKRGRGFGTTLALAIAIVALAIAIGVGLARFGSALPLVGTLFGEQPARTTTSPVVVEGIQKLDELSTVRWTESVVVTRESGGSRLEQALTGEKIILVASGEVEAGVNLSGLGQEDVRVEEEAVTIRLPEAEILGSSLDEENTRVYDRDRGLLNLGADDELVGEARQAAEAEILAASRENDILDQAETNAEDSIRAFVTTLGFEEVRFE
jgi:hypothetical protein